MESVDLCKETLDVFSRNLARASDV